MKTFGRLFLLLTLFASPAAMSGCGDDDEKSCSGTKETGATCESNDECASCVCRALDGPPTRCAPPLS